MHLSEADVQLFLAIVQTFIDALPPCPKQKLHAYQPFQSETDGQERRKRRNVITLLRNGVTELSRDLVKDCITCNLRDDTTFDKASEALGKLLVTLDGLVGDSILKESPVSSVSPKCAFLARLQPSLGCSIMAISLYSKNFANMIIGRSGSKTRQITRSRSSFEVRLFMSRS